MRAPASLLGDENGVDGVDDAVGGGEVGRQGAGGELRLKTVRIVSGRTHHIVNQSGQQIRLPPLPP